MMKTYLQKALLLLIPADFPRDFPQQTLTRKCRRLMQMHLSCSLLKLSPLQHPKQMKKNVHGLIYSLKRKEDAQHTFFLHQSEAPERKTRMQSSIISHISPMHHRITSCRHLTNVMVKPFWAPNFV